MSDNNKKALTIAMCGLDGVGKTSLFNLLSERITDDSFSFMRKGRVDSERMVERYMPRKYGDYRDWIQGPYSEAIALACAMDYCVYYDDSIKPKIEDYKTRVIITDRHAVCFIAYADINQTPNPIAIELLQSVTPPDIIIYITLSDKKVAERARNSGKPFDEFEDPRSQILQKQSYERLLPTYGPQVIKIDNGADIEDTYKKVLAHIEECTNNYYCN